MKTLRELFRHLPHDGRVRSTIRTFNLSPNFDGKARSVKELAESLGFNVYQVALPGKMAGRLVSDAFAENGYAIEVNKSHSVESRRWSVLHEMGHFFLHSNRSDPMAPDMFLDRSDFAFYEDPKEEMEANRFAAVLLFGDGTLRAAVSLHGRDRAKLAKLFGVSETTIEIAMEQFL